MSPLRRTHPPAGDEGGFSLVIVALTLVILMIFVAFAVDLGQVYNERRQDQSAADVGALGGMQNLGSSRASAAQEAVRLTHESLTSVPSLAAWQARFQTDCTDADRVARGYTQLAAGWGDCISFTPNNQRMRVLLPLIEVKAAFGRVVGIDSFDSRAFAEVQADIDASGNVLPYGLVAGASVGEICLKSGANPNTPAFPYGACEGPQIGNFGRLNISLYGNFTLGTPQDCATTGNSDGRLATNTALGVDHPLSLHATGNPSGTTVNDEANCFNFLARPNQLESDTGNPNAGLNEGMYHADVQGLGVPGRLAQSSPYPKRANVRTGYPDMDDHPLWEFIPDGLTNVPATCLGETFDNGVSNAELANRGVALDPVTGEPPWRVAPYPTSSPNESKAHLRVCFADYVSAGSTAVLFGLDTDGDAGNRSYDIQKSKRFGWVPRLWESSFGPGTKDVHIADFSAVWVQSLFFACNANGCSHVFEPGEAGIGLPAGANQPADALSAMLFKMSMLPREIIEDRPGQTSSVSYSLIR